MSSLVILSCAQAHRLSHEPILTSQICMVPELESFSSWHLICILRICNQTECLFLLTCFLCACVVKTHSIHPFLRYGHISVFPCISIWEGRAIMSLPYLRLFAYCGNSNEHSDGFAGSLGLSYCFSYQLCFTDPKKKGLWISPIYLPWCVDASLFL